MGLLENLVGKALGGLTSASQKGDLMQEVIGLLNGPQGAGLNGLVQQFASKGLGDIVNSWVGKGQNMPISGDQVQQGLGADVVSRLAAKVGIPADQLSSLLAQHLPNAVDRLTPEGQVPQGDISQVATKILGGLFK